MHTSLSQLVNQKIKLAIRGIDKTEQLQSVIDPELIFKRNSLNLLIGRRGSGKTFNVMRELIKLSELPDMANYNSFIYGCIYFKVSMSVTNQMLLIFLGGNIYPAFISTA